MLLRRLACSSLQIRAYSVTKVTTPCGSLLICYIPKKEKVGFIGIGNMGGHMATNLMKSGHSVIVHDKDSSAVDKMVAMGAKSAANPADVAMETSTIITMLPSR